MGMVLELRAVPAGAAAALLEHPADVERALVDPAGPEAHVDLATSWHGVHYLLTGTAWDTSTTLGLAVLGGREVGDDVGYGPPRLLEPGEVREIATALADVDHELLRQRFDPGAFAGAEIYPTGIWNEAAFDDYLLPHLADLTQFYSDAAQSGSAVLLELT